jgi:dTMP kinase
VFITLDGPNGVGKTTTIHALAERLGSQGLDVVLLRQPSESELGNFARSSEQQLTGMALGAVVVADRYFQIETAIKPALAEGRTVLCDRYVASTLALQRLDGVDIDVLWEMNTQALVPDLSVLLSADAPTLERRLNERGRTSRFERMAGIAALEITYFKEAFDLLRRVGYTTLELCTGATTPEATADSIAAAMGGTSAAP